MFKRLRRNFVLKTRAINLKSLTKTLPGLALACTVALTPVFGQEIMIDGKTNTSLNTNGITTNISTSTIKGSNAYNSFIKFNVNKDKVVNLNVPDNCTGLINLVHDEATSINGVLNSVKSGKVGGNIFLVNPHGITVGSEGVVNVGSLTAVTPTTDYMNNFFDDVEMPNEDAVISLLNGTVPINTNAQFVNDGKINAIENVKIDTGDFTNTGEIYNGAVFQENDITLGDVVNLNTLESGSSMALNNGEIVIKADNNVINEGKIVADGNNNINAGSVNITAKNNITLEENSLISAKGKGKNSNGGDIYIYADNNSCFNEGSIIDARGGDIYGDGGFIELSATNEVKVSGQFKANPTEGNLGTILIDPTSIAINTDQILPGTNINWTADEQITISGVTVSTRVIGGSTDYANAASTGDSGDITMTAPLINISSEIYSQSDNGFTGGDLTLNANGVGASNINFTNGIVYISTSIIKANNIYATATAGEGDQQGLSEIRIYNNSLLTSSENIECTATGGTTTNATFSDTQALIYIQDSTTLNSGEDIIFSSTGGTSTASITSFTSGHTEVTDSTLTANGNIEFTSTAGTSNISAAAPEGHAYAKIENSDLEALDNINIETATTQDGFESDINIDSDSTLTAGGLDRDLIINTNGTIDKTNSNMNAIIAGSINLSNISEGNITLTATKTDGDGTISGSGTLNTYEGYRSIDITNNSDLDLELSDISTFISGTITKTGSYTGSYAENVTIDNTSKDINITNNGTSDILLSNDIINPGGNITITNMGNEITGDNCIISTRLIGGSTDYANAASTGNSGSLTMTSSRITIDNTSEIYTQGDNNFAGDNITLDADASGINGVNDASAKVQVENSTIKGNAISLSSTGGTADSSAYARTQVLDSTLTSSSNITLDSTGGTADDFAEAIAYSDNTTLTSYGNIEFTATGGTTNDNFSDAYASIYAIDSTLTSNKEISFTATGGMANAIISTDADGITNIMNSSLNAVDDITLIATTTQAGHNSNVDIDSTSTLTAGSFDRDLVINANGVIDTSVSNIYATIGGSIDVSNINEANITLTATQADGVGTITGSGTLTTYNGYQSIDITNNLDLDLELNTINTEINGEIIKTGNYTGSYTENVTIDNTPKDINITNNGTSDILLNDQVINSNKDVTITNTGGSILDNSGSDANPNITSINLTLLANSAGATIGTSGEDLDIDTTGDINVTANDIINLTEISGDLITDNISHTNGELILRSTNGSIVGNNILTGTNLSLNANNTIGTMVQALEIEATGTLTAFTNNEINILELSGDINVNYVNSGAGEIKLVTHTGSILDGSVDDSNPNITTTSLTLIADQAAATIGSSGEDFDVYLTGNLNATADDLINITASNGNLNVDHVESTNDNVYLTASNGSIFDVSGSTIIGEDIELSALSGSIGTDVQSVHIDQTGSTGLIANAGGIINITEVDGDFLINSVSSNSNNVILESTNGSILDALDTVADRINVKGNNITLTANSAGATIGTGGINDNTNIGIDLNNSSILTATADNGINIYANSDVQLSNIISTNGLTSINVKDGSIYNNGTGTKITSPEIDLYVGHYIGQEVEKLGIETSTLTVNMIVGTKHVYIQNNAGDLNLKEIVANDDTIYLANTDGSILDGSATDDDPNVLGKNVTIIATGTIGTGAEDFDINTTGTVNMTADGVININETTDTLNLGQIQSANGDVTIVSDGDILDADTGTANTNIAGNIINLTSTNGSIGTTTDTIHINSNTETGVVATANDEINLTEDDGDFHVNNISSTTDEVILRASNGSIVDISGLVSISGNDISLYAENAGGEIGTTSQVIIDLLGGELTAYADGIIQIIAKNNDITINHVESYNDDVVLIANDGSILNGATGITTGEYISLRSEVGGIGTAIDPIQVNNLGDAVAAIAELDIYINETSGDMPIRAMDSANGDVTVSTTNGSILNDCIKVSADNITFNANGGSIGTMAEGIRLDLTGLITATATNDINLYTNFSDIKVNQINSTNGDVKLTSNYASILDSSVDDSNPNITGANVTLSAENTDQTIGTSGEDLDINTTGTVNASSDGVININETTGTLSLGQIQSANNDVTIVSDGDILDADTGTADTNISSNEITLTSTNGSIGTTTDTIHIDSNTATGVNATADDEINLTEDDGDFNVDTIKSTNGEVILRATNGNLSDTGGAAFAVEGNGIILYAESTGSSIAPGGSWFDINNTGGEITAYADSNITLEINDNIDIPINHIESYNDSIRLTTINTNYIKGSEGIVIGEGISITTTNGSIGTSLDYIQVDTSANLLTVYAGNNTYINEISGDLSINSAYANNGNLSILTNNGSILQYFQNTKAGGNITLTANNGSIGTMAEAFGIEVGGTLTATATNDINIIELSGDINVDQVNSTSGDVKLVTNTGSILDGSGDDANPNITGGNLTLLADQAAATIGTAGEDLDVEITGNLNATADGVINITAMDNNMNVDHVESTNDDVILTAMTGNIIDVSGSTIVGEDIELVSASGSIGTEAQTVHIDQTGSVGLIANAEGIINITEIDGDFNISSVTSNSDDVILESTNGSILDSSGVETANIESVDLTLTTNVADATIGTAIEDLDINTTGAVNATSDGLINLNGTAGTLSLGQIQSANNDVTIVSDGDILDADLDNEPFNVSGSDVSLTSTNGAIGTSALNGDIDLIVNGNLTVNTDTDAYISGNITGSTGFTGDNLTLGSDNTLNISSITAANNVIITSLNGNITDNLAGEGANITATNLSLNATNGTIGDADDINVDLSGTIDALADGNIKIENVNETLNVHSIQSTNNGDISLISNSYNIPSGASITTNGDTILSRSTAGDFEVSDVGNIKPEGIDRINSRVIIGNHSSTNELTTNIDIKSNVYTDGDHIEFSGTGTITVFDNVLISTRDLADVWSDDHENALSQGDSGDIIFESNDLDFSTGSKLLAFANNNYESGDILALATNTIDTEALLKGNLIGLEATTINSNGMQIISDVDGAYLIAENLNLDNSTSITSAYDIGLASDNYNLDASTILNATEYTGFGRYTNGDIEVSSAGNITLELLSLANGDIVIGNHPYATDTTNKITVKEDILTDGNDIVLNCTDTISTDPGVTISTRDLADAASGDHLSDPSQGDSGDIIFQTDGNIELGTDSALLAFADNEFTGGDISITGLQDVSTLGAIKANNIEITALGNLDASGFMTADSEIALMAMVGNITQTEGSLIAPLVGASSLNSSIGTSDKFIRVDANNCEVDMDAENNIYLDALYGSNSFSLHSESGISYLKMHTDILIPISSNNIPKPPVVEIPPQEITINTDETPIIEEPDQPQEKVINKTEAPVIEPQEIISDTTKTPIITSITITKPIIDTININGMVQSVLDQAINIYNNAINNGIDSQEALNKAVDILLDSNISKKDAEELLQSKIFINSAYLEILEHYIQNKKISIAK